MKEKQYVILRVVYADPCFDCSTSRYENIMEIECIGIKTATEIQMQQECKRMSRKEESYVLDIGYIYREVKQDIY